MKRILINKSNDLLRVARTDGQTLYDLELEHANKSQMVDSICNGEVVSIEPSLEAAFVNFGSKRNGFLPLKEVSPNYHPKESKGRRPSIKDVLFEGQKILIQVNKEERGTKGAALSTYISLAGCYLVLMPNNPKAGGISRRIEGEEREELRAVLDSLNIPSDKGVIVRTAGLGKSAEELQWDLDVLLQLWESIQAASKANGAPHLIHQESDIAIRAVRDHLRQDTGEILVDDKEIYERVRHYIERVRPDFIDRVKLYIDDLPLFSRFQLEKQIESAYQRKVRLPSGGEIVIDRSEALTAIDVNSAQATKGRHIEETALNTNLEAADEIAKQLRIRDVGGLIVIDFIDMDWEENNRKVENRTREALRTDRARIQLAPISRFGLLEMSRQRLRPALSEASLVVCPRCHGQGSIRSVQSQAMSILHLIEESSQKKNINQIQVQLPVELATYLLNERRYNIADLEQKQGISVIIIANPHLETPDYEIETLNISTLNQRGKKQSYEMVKTPSVAYETGEADTGPKRRAAVEEILPEKPAPVSKRKKKTGPGLLSRLVKALLGEEKKKKPSKKPYRNNRQGYKSKSRSSSSRGGQRSRRPREDSRGNYQQRSRRTSDRDTRSDSGKERKSDSGRSDTRTDSRSDSRQRRSSAPRRSEGNRPDTRRPSSRRGGNQGSQRPKDSSQQRSRPERKPAESAAPRKPAESTTPRKPVETARPQPGSIIESLKIQEPAIQKPKVEKPVFKPTPVEQGDFKQVETSHKPSYEPAEETRKEEKREVTRKYRQAEPKHEDSGDFAMVETKKDE